MFTVIAYYPDGTIQQASVEDEDGVEWMKSLLVMENHMTKIGVTKLTTKFEIIQLAG